MMDIKFHAVVLKMLGLTFSTDSAFVAVPFADKFLFTFHPSPTIPS